MAEAVAEAVADVVAGLEDEAEMGGSALDAKRSGAFDAAEQPVANATAANTAPATTVPARVRTRLSRTTPTDLACANGCAPIAAIRQYRPREWALAQ